MFVPRGYALVVVDARGTGASFGTRDSFRSPRERADYKAIADWIVAQPWSDGRIGATGISYLGAACDFLASTGHHGGEGDRAPVRRVGHLGRQLLSRRPADQAAGAGLRRADAGARPRPARPALRSSATSPIPALLGPMPVDDDRDGALARDAVKGHLANFRMPDFITEFKFRDDALPYDPSFTSASFSPYNYLDEMPQDVAVYAVSGWMDGAGYANGALSRFLTLPNAERRIMLGPWDHGARVNVSPWRARVEPELPVLGEVLRFFDEHLAGRETGLADEDPIHYFAMHAEEWRAARSWPPVNGSRRLYTARGRRARRGAAQRQPWRSPGQADFTFGTGDRDALRAHRRHRGHVVLRRLDRPRAPPAELHQRAARRAARDRRPSRRSRCGFPRASPMPRCSSTFPRSRPTARRATSPRACCAPSIAPRRRRRATTARPGRGAATRARTPGRCRPGEPQLLRFALLPTAWRFATGSRIRLSPGGRRRRPFRADAAWPPAAAHRAERRRARKPARIAGRRSVGGPVS